MSDTEVLEAFDGWPGHFLVTDYQGRIRAVSRSAQQLLRFCPRSSDADVPISLATLLTSASRVLFETTLLPQLIGHGAIADVLINLRGRADEAVPMILSARCSSASACQIRWLLIDAPGRAAFEREMNHTRKALADLAHELAAAKQILEQRQEIILSQAHELVELNSRLRNQAMLDPVTKLYNRRGFWDTIIEMEKTGLDGCGALLAIDIDHFKVVNDSYGHPFGDRVLHDVANAIQQAVRRQDLVARFGGEEFIVWMPGGNLEIARAIAERVRQAIAQLHFTDQPDFRVTGSIGIAIAPTREEFERTMMQADEALYAAKKAGRNCCVFYGPNGVEFSGVSKT